MERVTSVTWKNKRCCIWLSSPQQKKFSVIPDKKMPLWDSQASRLTSVMTATWYIEVGELLQARISRPAWMINKIPSPKQMPLEELWDPGREMWQSAKAQNWEVFFFFRGQALIQVGNYGTPGIGYTPRNGPPNLVQQRILKLLCNHPKLLPVTV